MYRIACVMLLLSLTACGGGQGFKDRTSSQDLEKSPCACNYQYKMIGGQLYKKKDGGTFKPVKEATT